MKKLTTFIIVAFLFLQGCASPTPEAPAVTEAPATEQPAIEAAATEAPTAEPIVHTTIPQSGTRSRSNAHDQEESTTFDNKNVTNGDDFLKNQFERPFTADGMTYLPDIDIVDFGITSDNQFFYIKIFLAGLDDASQSLTGSYAVEIDRNADGRAEILLSTRAPYSTDFTADNVYVFVDVNGDIGGTRATRPDAIFTGDGYDGVIFDLSRNIFPEDPDLAWVHFVPGDKPAIEIAYKKWIFKDGNEKFMWNVWASKQQINPHFFNLHDTTTTEEAGSPDKNNADYPIKLVSEVDNSCRVPLGFDASGSEPMGCLVKINNAPALSEEEILAAAAQAAQAAASSSSSGSGGAAGSPVSGGQAAVPDDTLQQIGLLPFCGQFNIVCERSQHSGFVQIGIGLHPLPGAEGIPPLPLTFPTERDGSSNTIFISEGQIIPFDN